MPPAAGHCPPAAASPLLASTRLCVLSRTLSGGLGERLPGKARGLSPERLLSFRSRVSTPPLLKATDGSQGCGAVLAACPGLRWPPAPPVSARDPRPCPPPAVPGTVGCRQAASSRPVFTLSQPQATRSAWASLPVPPKRSSARHSGLRGLCLRPFRDSGDPKEAPCGRAAPHLCAHACRGAGRRPGRC